MSPEDLKAAKQKIEECESAAESLLQCARHRGHIFILTLSSRSKLVRQCQTWYPRVWKLLNDSQIKIVCPMDSLRQNSPSLGKVEEISAGYWAHVKGQALTQEIDKFYSQYQGQTWKNVISIGDSPFELYGTIGAACAYVEKLSGGTDNEGSAYVKAWQKFDSKPGPRFDSNPHWSEGLEGIHEGHVFNVRTKVIKLLDSPSPSQLAQQLTLLSSWISLIVSLDSCLKLYVDNLNEDTVKQLESVLEHKDVNQLHNPHMIPAF